MGVNNHWTGIMHLSQTTGGRPACKRRNAHMSVNSERFADDPKPCKACAKIFIKWQAIKAKREATA
jgi:hypothetical protein